MLSIWECAIHLTSFASVALPLDLTLNACIITKVFLSSNKLLTSNAHLSCLKNETLRFSFLSFLTHSEFLSTQCLCLEHFLPNEEQNETFKKKTNFSFRFLLFSECITCENVGRSRLGHSSENAPGGIHIFTVVSKKSLHNEALVKDPRWGMKTKANHFNLFAKLVQFCFDSSEKRREKSKLY